MTAIESMTNEAIDLKLAEIEGWKFHTNEPGIPDHWEHRSVSTRYFEKPSNPPPYSTDWAWCGPLIEKYRLDLTAPQDILARDWFAYQGDNIDTGKYHRGVYADTPQRAICLAVLARNEALETTSG